MGNIYVGTNPVKKIYVGTQEVKKVYVGTTLVWQSTKPTETGSWSVGTYTQNFGSDKFQIRVIVTVTEKNYGANSMKISVAVQIGSISNYHVTASTSRTATVTINGTNYTTNAYNATMNANSFKTIHTFTGVSISGASGKTINISTSIPLHVTVSGVGSITTVTSSHSVKLPTL